MWGNKREKRTTSSRKRKIAMLRWDSFKDACARRVWKGVGSAVRKTYSYPICWREDRTYFCQSQKHNYFSRPKVENKHGLEGVARQKWSWSMVHFLDVLNRVKLYINISQLHMFIWTVIGKTNINSYWGIKTLQRNLKFMHLRYGRISKVLAKFHRQKVWLSIVSKAEYNFKVTFKPSIEMTVFWPYKSTEQQWSHLKTQCI